MDHTARCAAEEYRASYSLAQNTRERVMPRVASDGEIEQRVRHVACAAGRATRRRRKSGPRITNERENSTLSFPGGGASYTPPPAASHQAARHSPRVRTRGTRFGCSRAVDEHARIRRERGEAVVGVESPTRRPPRLAPSRGGRREDRVGLRSRTAKDRAVDDCPPTDRSNSSASRRHPCGDPAVLIPTPPQTPRARAPRHVERTEWRSA